MIRAAAPTLALALALSAALSAGGCCRPCAKDSVFLSIDYDPTIAGSSGVMVNLRVRGGTTVKTATHRPGTTSDTMRVDFAPSYPAGEMMSFEVLALDDDPRVIGRGADETRLDQGCAAVTIHVLPVAAMTFPVGRASRRADVLFLIDNSASMAPMVGELAQRFGEFADGVEAGAAAGSPLDLHLGVVTSDYGAGATGAPGCDKQGGGQGGLLQPMGAFAPAGCAPPTDGARYVAYTAGGGPSNLPPDHDLAAAFRCMSAVAPGAGGRAGCGFQQPLESAWTALHDATGNAGFLRDDALLAVVFLTNEDDSSVPATSDLFDPAPSKVAAYGHLDSYRGTRFGVVCGDPAEPPPYGPSDGRIRGCVPAPNPDGAGPGLLHDVSRYTSFFSKPAAEGGLKERPDDVILVAIDGPAEPFEVILSDPATPPGQPYHRCARLDEAGAAPCVPVLERSCSNASRPLLFGDPAVRLNAVVAAAPTHLLASICDVDRTGALGDLAAVIGAKLSGACIPGRLPGGDVPPCVVEDVATDADGVESLTPIPSCAATDDAPPCWRTVERAECPGAHRLLTVDRGGVPRPEGATTRAACAAR